MPGANRLVRVHTAADGVVWFGDDANLAVSTGLPAGRACAAGPLPPALRRADQVRAVGSAGNAPILLGLAAATAEGTLRVAAPSAVHGRHPRPVLAQLLRPPPTAFLAGSWHTFTAADWKAYAVTAAVRAGDAAAAWKLLPDHPAWPALSFVDGLDAAAAAAVVAAVVDPRWYAHPLRPGRLTRLLRRLGVTPWDMAAACGRGGGGPRAEEAKAVVAAWRGGSAAGPGGFACRALLAAKDEAAGVLAGSVRFVRFVAGVWLAAVTRGPGEPTFDAARFFRDGPTAAAFEAHQASSTN